MDIINKLNFYAANATDSVTVSVPNTATSLAIRVGSTDAALLASIQTSADGVSFVNRGFIRLTPVSPGLLDGSRELRFDPVLGAEQVPTRTVRVNLTVPNPAIVLVGSEVK